MLTKDTTAIVRAMEEAAKEVAKAQELTIDSTHTVGPHGVSVTLHFSSANVPSAEALWNFNAELIGAEKDWFGKTVQLRTGRTKMRTFTVVGLRDNFSHTDTPILLSRQPDGKRFRISVAQTRHSLVTA